jgi:hypothetical protein
MTTPRQPILPLSSPPPAVAPCPTNQQVGPRLDSLTLKALLAVPLTMVAADATYQFCPAPDCPTVYYRGDGQQVFREQDLRERVYQKHADDPTILICYCFGYRVADVLAEWERKDVTTVIERIQAGIQAGQCACDIRNPQGRCCLGNVRELVDRLAVQAPNKGTQNG